MRNLIFLTLLLAGFLVGCKQNGTNVEQQIETEEDKLSEKEAVFMDSVSNEIEKAGDDIKDKSEELDSLLNEL
ncbi:MAG: hypothetical protein KDE33_19775 [Bacteroidetes bacterium]|nr:hypothetical protein [Bacteroidota bacterium]MCB9226349.1 hypothetical protein [Chitinophagales bacterium]